MKTYSGGPRALAQALGELFSRVQATPIFPYYVNYRRLPGLSGCRSTTTESGWLTIVMNQIRLTKSDQNVFQ